MHMGVFLLFYDRVQDSDGFPHAHGGVSYSPGVYEAITEFSPCTWGCFLRRIIQDRKFEVFPMHMGVFLVILFTIGRQESFPHAHGGVSLIQSFIYSIIVFSPCTWGCFQKNGFVMKDYFVFPMHMGVFLL